MLLWLIFIIFCASLQTTGTQLQRNLSLLQREIPNLHLADVYKDSGCKEGKYELTVKEYYILRKDDANCVNLDVIGYHSIWFHYMDGHFYRNSDCKVRATANLPHACSAWNDAGQIKGVSFDWL
ncbi:unnamed protein product [Sympodiomycopsis kandeliae]